MTRDKIIGQLRYDFLQLGWVMAIWAGWIGAEALSGWWRWQALSAAENHHFIVFFSDRILPLIGTALVAVLSPALAFGHSLWRSDAFWRTRPLPVRHLFFSRVGFLLVAVGVIPCLIRYGILTRSGVEFRLAFVHTAGWSLAYLAPAFALWGLAMLFPKWRYLVAATVLLLPVLGPSLWKIFSDLPSLSRFPLENGMPDGLWESRALLGLILLGAGGLLAGAILFWQRLRLAGICLLGLAIIGCAAIANWWQINLFDGEHVGTKHSQPGAWVEFEKDAELGANGELFWESVDVPDYYWIGRVDIDTRYPLAHGPIRFQRRIPIRQSPEMDVSAQRALGGRGAFVNGIDRIREGIESIRTPITKPGRRLPGGWVINGRIDAHWFSHEVAGSLPLEPDARLVRDGRLVAIDSAQLVWDYLNVHQHLSITLIVDRVRARFTENEYWHDYPSSDPFQEWHLVLQIPAGEEGTPDRVSFYHFGKLAFTDFREGVASISAPVFDKSKPGETPLIAKERIGECRLLMLRPVYRETMSAVFSGGSDRDAPVDGAAD